ncbi:xanthine dehydrogenase family protein molybdopterin-binding subunit, partial [Pseudoalteromonas sp. SIMBA_148]
LIDLALTITTPEADKLKLKTRKEWRYINTGMANIDLADLVTGKAIFAADVSEPKALVAIIESPPVVGGVVKSFDT